MMNMANKKEYSKPTVKAVRWDMKEALCDTTYLCSPCVVVRDQEGTTRRDIIRDIGSGTTEWHDVEGTASINSWPSGSR